MKLGHSSSQLVMSIFPKMPTTNTLSETVIEVRGKKKTSLPQNAICSVFVLHFGLCRLLTLLSVHLH